MSRSILEYLNPTGKFMSFLIGCPFMTSMANKSIYCTILTYLEIADESAKPKTARAELRA
jgi:hypothetical protein